MLFSLPSRSSSDPIEIPVPSSEGGAYFVSVSGGQVRCGADCSGFRYRHHCRHVAEVRDWLGAIIPPGNLPGIIDRRKGLSLI